MPLETAHLELIPFSPTHLLALIEGEAQFEASCGLPAAEGLRGFYVSDEIWLDWLAQLRAASPSADPWVHGFAVVHQESRSVIGSVGFKGPPDDEGLVEIAYGIVPVFQRRGHATEAAEACIAFAVEHGPARLIRAHTRPTPNASTRVLEKCGFERTDEIVDPDDGPVWRWERKMKSG